MTPLLTSEGFIVVEKNTNVPPEKWRLWIFHSDDYASMFVKQMHKCFKYEYFVRRADVTTFERK